MSGSQKPIHFQAYSHAGFEPKKKQLSLRANQIRAFKRAKMLVR